jgi:hypothetical protein
MFAVANVQVPLISMFHINFQFHVQAIENAVAIDKYNYAYVHSLTSQWISKSNSEICFSFLHFAVFFTFNFSLNFYFIFTRSRFKQFFHITSQ